MKGKIMPTLTHRDMRAFELILEQMDRFSHYAKMRQGTPMDVIVREFFEELNGSEFEYMILRQIGALLAAESQ